MTSWRGLPGTFWLGQLVILAPGGPSGPIEDLSREVRTDVSREARTEVSREVRTDVSRDVLTDLAR